MGGTFEFNAKRFPKYPAEFEFRHNRRDRLETMLTELLLSFPR